MARLTVRVADEYAGRLYSEDVRIEKVSRDYSREEIIAFLRDCVAEIRAEVKDMSPAQLAYRLAGKPEGADASGDEEHFDTSEIVTHLASVMFHW